MVRIKGFGRQGCDIRNVKGIGERAKRGGVGSRTLSLAGARLGSQTLAVAGKRMGFQALSNQPMKVGGAGNNESCESRVGFQTLL